MLIIYKLLITFFYPFLKIYIRLRIYLGKEDDIRYKEKFAITHAKRTERKLVWFHAASVGEMKSIVELIERFTKDGFEVLITSVTKTSAQIYSQLNLEHTQHQFAPFDVPHLIEKFLSNWQPNLAVFVDSEIWPNMLIKTKNICNIALINARLSKKSFSRWMIIKYFARYLFNKFSLIVPSSKADLIRFRAFSSSVKSTPINLKYFSNIDKPNLVKIQNVLAGKIVILCASSHHNEEEIVLRVFKKLKQQNGNLLLIVIPRHPERGDNIYKIANNMFDRVGIKSHNHAIDDCEVYIVDGIGELVKYYHLSQVVFVGGSLVPHGGQNPIEAAKTDNCILIGPHYFNFQEVVDNLKENEAIIVIKDEDDLYRSIIKLLSNSGMMKEYASNAYQFCLNQENKLDEIYDQLKILIK